VGREVESSRLMDTVVGFGEALVEDLYLFDVFAGDPIPAGKKSVSFRIVYRSAEGTLEDETVNEIHHRLTQRLIAEFGAMLPA
jgi:phenylalanyl-tRNA synthetase beta chain